MEQFKDYLERIEREKQQQQQDNNVINDQDEIVIVESGIAPEDAFEIEKQRILQEERAKRIKEEAKAEAIRQLNEELGITTDIDEPITESGNNNGVKRRTRVKEDSEVNREAVKVIDKIKEEVEEIVMPALVTDDIDQRNVEESRDKDYERQFGQKFTFEETVYTDIRDGRKPSDWQEDHEIKTLFDYITYVFGFNKVASEIYKERTKNVIKELLLVPDKVANYRYVFKDEGYEGLLGMIPKHIKKQFSEDYLKDTFILFNIVYKFGKGALTLDFDDLVTIILENNAHLPATVKYGLPYTREFLLNLSTFGILTAIQNMCIEESTIEQAMLLMGMVQERLQAYKESGKQNTNEMKQLAETLEKLDKINSAHKVQAIEDKDAIVYRVPEKGLDYSKFLHIEPYKGKVGKEKDREYNYYISASKIDINGNEEFIGWVMDQRGTVGRSNIFMIDSDNKAAMMFKEIDNNRGVEDKDIKYTLRRLDVREMDILLEAESYE